MADRPRATAMDGFTLLEVMVALAIFATLAAAVSSAGRYVIRQSAQVEQRLFAAWLADNRLSELRLQKNVVPGLSQHTLHMDRRDWLLHQRINVAGDPQLFRVELTVSLSGDAVQSMVGWVPRHDE
ncbi:type II secretion system protein GspI [Pseudomonas syringae]|nr:type II secretion system protein GspI [Pseudomonas syringae]MCF5069869.1 type II secretion system protein GspI [Pseudomonas syringae]